MCLLLSVRMARLSVQAGDVQLFGEVLKSYPS